MDPIFPELPPLNFSGNTMPQSGGDPAQDARSLWSRAQSGAMMRTQSMEVMQTGVNPPGIPNPTPFGTPPGKQEIVDSTGRRFMVQGAEISGYADIEAGAFEVIQRSSDQAGINPYSYLVDKDLHTVLTISNLNDAFSVSVGDKIWLKIVINNDYTVGDITIEHGGEWDGFPDPIEIDSSDSFHPFQKAYHLMIGDCVSLDDLRPGIVIGTGSSSPVKIIQLINQNRILTLWAVNGIVCHVPEPFNGQPAT